MRTWQDELWVKLYTRDEADWLVMPWWVRGLFYEIMKRVDRAGVLRLGKAGRRALAASLSATWDDFLADAVQTLADDGCIVFDENETVLVIPNFIDAQGATSSDKARQRSRRERKRALVTKRDDVLTERDATITKRDRGVTFDHAVSRGVTPCHDEIRVDEKREEKIPPIVPPGGQPVLKLAVTPEPTPEPEAPKAKPAPGPGPADRVFQYWRGKHMPRAKQTHDRMRKIRARLKEGYSEAELCAAVDGVFHDDFLMGANEQEKQYRDIVTIFKSGSKVDALIALAEAAEVEAAPPEPEHPPDPPGTVYCGPPEGFFEQVRSLGKG
jgi:hypothetical protein